MKYPREEQETIIRKGALENEWHIYTSDDTMITKLDKLVAASDEWRCVNVTTCQGEICAKDYRCTEKMLSFNSKKRTVTDEQRAHLKALSEKYGFGSK